MRDLKDQLLQPGLSAGKPVRTVNTHGPIGVINEAYLLSRHRYTSNGYTLVSDLPVEELARVVRSVEVLLSSYVSMLEQCALLTSPTHVLDATTGKCSVEERPRITVTSWLSGGAVGAYEALTKYPDKSPD
jgi:hypothetical protein